MPVARIADIDRRALALLLARYELDLRLVGPATDIPASYWGECEAGLQGGTLFARSDTPVHSALHEGAHYVCMDTERRVGLNTDAGGDFAEEDAVCYLQILLADELPGVGRARMLADMDEWGYTFRLGSAGAWFAGDAADARAWLVQHGLLDAEGRLTFKLRY
jgi:hypothetical protein